MIYIFSVLCIIYVSRTDGSQGKPTWNITLAEDFELSFTRFQCSLTNVNCNPMPDNIYIQKYVEDGFYNAIRVFDDDTYDRDMVLPDGHTIADRIEVKFDGAFGINFRVWLYNITLADDGIWRCTVDECNSALLESEPANLTVITQLDDTDVVISQPDYILLGYPMSYTCMSDRVNPIFDVIWKLHGTNYTNGTINNEEQDYYYTIRNSNEFTFCENRNTDVTCILDKQTGNTRWSAQNTVQQNDYFAPPIIEFSDVSNNKSVITEDLILECTASGTTRMVIWKKDGQDIPGGLFTNKTENIRGTYTCGETDGNKTTLTWIQVQNPTCDDAVKHDGDYQCEVTGVFDMSDESQVYRIAAWFGPIISGEKESILEAMVGTILPMTCDTDCARPEELTYIWSSVNGRDGLDQNTKTITIVVRNDDFNDTFVCSVANDVGKNERTFRIDETVVTTTIPTTEHPTTEPLETTTDLVNVTSPKPPNTALIIANAVIWSLCGVVSVVLVCLALYHYRQIQNGKKYQRDNSEEIVLTNDEEKPGTSHGFGSGEYDDISHSVVGEVALGGAFGGVTTEGLYAEVQTSAQTQMPVAPKRASKIKTSQPEPSTPQAKRTHATNAPKSPMDARHQANSPSLAKRQEPQADYSPASKRKDIPPSHSSESNHGMASKVVVQQKRHESPNKQAAVKQHANGTKPSVPVKPDIQSFRSSRSSGINPAGTPYDNAEVNLYANCDQRPEPKNVDGTITYADLALQQEDLYEEGAPPVPKKNMTDQEPVQYASIKRNK